MVEKQIKSRVVEYQSVKKVFSGDISEYSIFEWYYLQWM
jgi:hypothetical protein